MSIIMSHQEWMKLTKGNFTKPRSTLLKAVDSALEKVQKIPNSTNKAQTLKALIAWQVSKGNAWKTSLRNQGNTVENLYKQLNGMDGNADQLALAHIRNESEEIFIKLFENKKLQYRSGISGKIAAIVGNSPSKILGVNIPLYSKHAKKAKVVTTTASAVTNGMTLAKKIIADTAEESDKSMVLTILLQILPSALDELAKSCAPFAGVAYSGGKVLVTAVQTANKGYKANRTKMHAQRTLSTGDPDAAIKSVIIMLDRELRNSEIELAKGLTEFSAKMASTLLDGGTASNAAIGFVSSIVKIIMMVRLIVLDIKEKNAVNKLLAQMATISRSNQSKSAQLIEKKTYAAKIFEANPLMGAYFVCCVPTSVFVNLMFSADKFNNPGMMDKIERATKHHIQPVRDRAGSLVRSHRMYIPSLQSYPGVLKVNKKNLEKMLENNGKTGMKGLGPDDFDDNGQLIG